MKPNQNPWVIVDNPGTDDEEIIIDFPTFNDAVYWMKNPGAWENVGIMKRQNDGTLTTEY